MRTALTVIYNLALATSGVSLLYLLFVLGHTETAPLGRVLGAAVLAGTSAVIAGVLYWVGLPSAPKENRKKRPRA